MRHDNDGPLGNLMRNGYTKKEWGTLSMLQGFALLLGAPFSQVRKLYLSRDAKGVADWMLINLGNKRAMEQAQRSARERNAMNY